MLSFRKHSLHIYILTCNWFSITEIKDITGNYYGQIKKLQWLKLLNEIIIILDNSTFFMLNRKPLKSKQEIACMFEILEKGNNYHFFVQIFIMYPQL